MICRIRWQWVQPMLCVDIAVARGERDLDGHVAEFGNLQLVASAESVCFASS